MELRDWKSELSGATAVTFMFGVQRYSTCSVYEPSLFANHFSSRRKFTPELAKRTPRTGTAQRARRLLDETSSDRLAALESRLRQLHAYELPEFLVITADAGSEAYLKWVGVSTHPGQSAFTRMLYFP